MAKKKKANKSGKKSKKAKRAAPARKKKVTKKTAKRTKRKLKNKRLFMSKPTPAPVVTPAPRPDDDLPVRPPVLCPGCPHRAVYAMLRREKVAVMGDIGCYTLGALPPLLSLESCLCMGASVGMMAGINRMMGRIAAVASSINGLITRLRASDWLSWRAS